MRLGKSALHRIKNVTLPLLICIVTSMSGWAEDHGFTPLMSSPSLEHFMGNKEYWSFKNGVLTGKTSAPLMESQFLFTKERFGNFVLRFLMNSEGGDVHLLCRARTMPPGYLVGYEAEIAGLHRGSLTLRKPGSAAAPSGSTRRAAAGFPDAMPQPFAQEAEVVPLVRVNPSQERSGSEPWARYEIAGLGNHILIKINGTTTAHYQARDGLEEGMIGFRLAPGSGTKVDLKDIEIRLIGEVHWAKEAPVGNLTGRFGEEWSSSAPDLLRKSDEARTQERRELEAMAKNRQGFRPLFDGKSLEGWQDGTPFWTVKEGVTVGKSHNSFLVTQKEYSNFILKGSVRLSPPGANSGVQVRSSVIPGGMLGYQFDSGMNGYQFDMGYPWWGQLHHEGSRRGILFPVQDSKKRIELVRADGWNNFIIICHRNHVMGQLNGDVTFDMVDHYGEKTGRIGLQIHVGPGMKVEFRDLEIKELP